MIFIGLDAKEKGVEIRRYLESNRIDRVFVLEPERFTEDLGLEGASPFEVVKWADIIKYRFFYRLLQEIDRHTLVVVNECLRVQDRYDLTYNCMRHFLAQAGHQLVFQYLPIIDQPEDFMILFDFDTKSRWKRSKLDDAPLSESQIVVKAPAISLTELPVVTTEDLKDEYRKKKRELIDGIGLKDPHTIPRNLYLLGGKAKAAAANPWDWHIARNRRLRLERLATWKDDGFPESCTAIELPHDFRHFIDFLTISRQTEVPVLVADLKVDRWYFDRYRDWTGRVRDACAAIYR